MKLDERKTKKIKNNQSKRNVKMVFVKIEVFVRVLIFFCLSTSYMLWRIHASITIQPLFIIFFMVATKSLAIESSAFNVLSFSARRTLFAYACPPYRQIEKEKPNCCYCYRYCCCFCAEHTIPLDESFDIMN